MLFYHFQGAYSAVPAHRRRRASTLCLTLMQDTAKNWSCSARRQPTVIWNSITELKCQTLRLRSTIRHVHESTWPTFSTHTVSV